MFLGRDEFVWWMGVVEDNEDPDKLGRVRVRIFGYHPGKNTNKVPTADLPFATVVGAANMPEFYGRIGIGEWVFGFFIDGKDAQEPAILGILPGKLDSKLNGWSEDKVKSFSHIEDINKDSISIRTKKGAAFELRNYIADNEPYSLVGLGTFYQNKFSGYSVRYQLPENKIINGIADFNGAAITIETPNAGADTYVNIRTGGIGDIDARSIRGNVTITNESTGSNVKVLNNGAVGLNATSGQDVVASGVSGVWGITATLRNHEDRIRNIEFPPPPPPSDGGDCFTANSLVTMAGGHDVKICDIEIGDFVLARDGKTLNKVKFIEIIEDTVWDLLYSPDEKHQPFATINHPLYIDGVMHSPDPDATKHLYPWLDKCEKIEKIKVIPAQGKLVYNLWVDGDHTYIVNGYGTHSIMDDGGFLAKAHSMSLLSHKQVMDIMFEFTTNGNDLQYGAYLLNKFVGMSNSRAVIKYFSGVMSADNSYLPRKVLLFAMKVASRILKAKSFITLL
jgi:hypothetical protein